MNGFTVIELMIVVVILGIIAAIVIPATTTQIEDVNNASLDFDLEMIRKGIELYYHQHVGVYPGYPDGDTSSDPTEEDFLNQMLSRTNRRGELDKDGLYGPYLRPDLGFPKNPFNKKDAISVSKGGGLKPKFNGDYGWTYNAVTGAFDAVTEEIGGNEVKQFD